MEALQFFYVRNWQRGEIIRRIALNTHPSCMQIMNFARLQRRLSEHSYLRDQISSNTKGTYLVTLGTKDGKIVLYRVSTQTPYSFHKLLETKAGNAYGGITSIDVVSSPSPDLVVDGDYLIAGTETGEVHQFELMNRLNAEE